MAADCEPWNNRYELDGETERLLCKLNTSPMSDLQVMRFCLREVDSLLTPEQKTRLESEIVTGATYILAFDLQPFSGAIAKWQEKMEELRQNIDWAEVPEELREKSKRRAECILRYSLENGWIERVEGDEEWRISQLGRELLEQGGFNMR
jgi:hypothetical protein